MNWIGFRRKLDDGEAVLDYQIVKRSGRLALSQDVGALMVRNLRARSSDGDKTATLELIKLTKLGATILNLEINSDLTTGQRIELAKLGARIEFEVVLNQIKNGRQ